MKKAIGLFILIGLGVLMASCEQEEDNQPLEDNELFKALYDTYEQQSDHLNGHSTDTDPWTLYVDTDTPDDITTELEETYTVVRRDRELIALGDLRDIVIGYISQLDTSWATVEVREDHVKIVVDDATTVESLFILDLVDEGRIVIEYSDAELVPTGD